ncbi:unnamed protein product [Paramecium primaurelia]|uniref:Uncharacterized protein n=1 Tax=Paramecium primaurelia TaxID=5886 RepID=A0A8S1NTE2_PARPR|nr:unnamed protein product [Paramecium primaurelia]
MVSAIIFHLKSINFIYDELKCINYRMKCSEFKTIHGPYKATLMNEITISSYKTLL